MEIVEFEATNLCNTHCLHCPRESLTRPLGKMSWDVFRPIADGVLACDTVQAVSFSGIGEPTLNPDLPRFIAYLSGRVSTVLTTNASTLSPRRAEKLLDAGLETIIISFNGHHEELYSQMMGGLSLERAAGNIRGFVQMAEGRAKVSANVSVTRQTESHLAALRTYLEDLGIHEILFSQCHNRGGHFNNPLVCETPLSPVNFGRCDIFAGTLFVAWNGDVLSCCHDLGGEAVLGNLTADRLTDVVEKRERISQHGVRFTICKDCNDMYRFGKDSTPDGKPLSEWIYALYAEKDARSAELLKAIREKDARIRELEDQIATYEKGWFAKLRQRVKQLY